MARNEEKAQAMLNRWYKMKRDLRNAEMGKYREAPEISKCISIQDCEFERYAIGSICRMELLKVVSKKVSDIQNAGLGEHRIRELNDEINKVIRQKHLWETRVKELGGPDYRRISAKMLDSTAVELPGGGGYKYFGCAKDLPGVRELFQKPTPYEPKKSRSELYRIVNFEYYGFAAHNDKELLEEEKRLEAEAHVQEIDRFCTDNPQIIELIFDGKRPTLAELQLFLDQQMKQREDDELAAKEENERLMMQELEVEALDRKKAALLKEYVHNEDRVNDYNKFQDAKDIEIEEMAKQMIKMNTQL